MDYGSSDETSLEAIRKTVPPSPSINQPEAALSPSSSSFSCSASEATLAAAASPDEPRVASSSSSSSPSNAAVGAQSSVTTVMLHGIPIVSLLMDGRERLCLAQISNTLLKPYSYNEIHNRRVALGITCVQCTPVQLEILRRAGAMPVSSRRCGMITKREAERLVKSFLDDVTPPKLPDDFFFDVEHDCGWGCRGCFQPSRYNSSRAKCIRCLYCDVFFSPNKFIFHFHRTPGAKYNHPDAANFNSWRRHLKLTSGVELGEGLLHAWEDVKAMFNGGNRRRLQSSPAAKPRRLGSFPVAAADGAEKAKDAGDVTSRIHMLGPSTVVGGFSGALGDHPSVGHLRKKTAGSVESPSAEEGTTYGAEIKDQAYPHHAMIRCNQDPADMERGQAPVERKEKTLVAFSMLGEYLRGVNPTNDGEEDENEDQEEEAENGNGGVDDSESDSIDVDTVEDEMENDGKRKRDSVEEADIGYGLKRKRFSSGNGEENGCTFKNVASGDHTATDWFRRREDKDGKRKEKLLGDGKAEGMDTEGHSIDGEPRADQLGPIIRGFRTSTDPWNPYKIGGGHHERKIDLNLDLQMFTREELQAKLVCEMETRAKVETEYRTLKDSFSGEVERERRRRDESDRHFEHLKGLLYRELDQERKSRLSLQHQLQEARDALRTLSYGLLLPTNRCAACNYKDTFSLSPSISFLSNVNVAFTSK